MIAFILLLIVNLILLQQTQEPRELKEVKEKYRTLREHLKDTNHEKFNITVPMRSYHGYEEDEWVGGFKH